MFWNTPKLPVTQNDQEWTEDSLLWLKEQFGEEFLKTVSIKTPTTKYFDRKFNRTEEDAVFALGKICEYMSVDPKTIYLSFYGQDDIAAIHKLPQGRQSSKTPAGLYTQWQEGYTEIALNLKELEDPISMISTMSHEISHVKLLGEKRILTNDEPLTDLVSVAFGFGIFRGNSVFRMRQWQGDRTQGWEMSKKGYLPEQVIAYAMAWIAAYQGDEDCVWSKHLNKTMSGLFESSKAYIKKHPEKIRFEGTSGNHKSTLAQTTPSGNSKVPEPVSYKNAQFLPIQESEGIPLPDINGKWAGVLIYGRGYGAKANSELYSSIKVKVTEEDEFEGTATDIKGVGMNPDGGTVTGFIDGNKISFIKKYKSERMKDEPSPDICYSGRFNQAKGEYEGEWVIERSKGAAGSGTWRMKKDESI
jgi:hypothetical protein